MPNFLSTGRRSKGSWQPTDVPSAAILGPEQALADYAAFYSADRENAGNGLPAPTLNDWSGNGRAASQGVQAKQAVWGQSLVSGGPGFLFDGSDDHYSQSLGGGGASADLTGVTNGTDHAFSVAAIVTLAAASAIRTLWTVSTNFVQGSPYHAIQVLAGGAWRVLRVGASSSDVFDGGAAPTVDPFMVIYTYSGAGKAHSLRCNGGAQISATGTALLGNVALVSSSIGAYNGGVQTWNGAIRELYVWGRALPLTDQQTLEAQWSDTFGIAL